MAKAKATPAFVGVDLGGTNIQAGVVTADHKVLSRAKAKTKADEGSGKVVKRIAETVMEALESAKLTAKEVGGLGIGAPGAVDSGEGLVLNAVNLRWNKFPLAHELSKEVSMRVTLDNDVNVGTWGEHVAGAGRGYEDVLGVFVGTGIGGGLVLGGELYHGHHWTAGEIGHTIIHADAPLGRRSLENCASRTNIARTLAQLIRANHKSIVSKLSGGDLEDVRSKVITQALEKEDELTQRVVKDAAHYVGVACANTVTMLSLPCVVLGGGLTDAIGKKWVAWVRESFDEHVFPSQLRSCKVLASELNGDAGVVGAADLARRRLGSKRA